MCQELFYVPHAESVADNGYKWTCKHGSEKQICLMSDNIECTCIDCKSLVAILLFVYDPTISLHRVRGFQH